VGRIRYTKKGNRMKNTLRAVWKVIRGFLLLVLSVVDKKLVVDLFIEFLEKQAKRTKNIADDKIVRLLKEYKQDLIERLEKIDKSS